MVEPDSSEHGAVGAKRRWRLLDPDFGRHYRDYLKQTVMATVSMLVVLLLLDLVDQTVLIAALGASTFILFSMPHRQRSQPRYLIGGYLVGMLAGCSWSVVESRLVHFGFAFADPRIIEVCCAALALGCAFLVMVATDTEHPPAAALALGFVLNDWDGYTLAVILCGIVLITMIKELIKPRLRDLL